jgi:uncharacterized protein YjbJ (UPF0337 family)
MDYDNDSRSGAPNLLIFMFGIAVGVAGTLVYAAINEEDFGRAVGKTKKLTGSVQDSLGDIAENAGNQIQGISTKAQEAYDGSVAKVKETASDLADRVQKTARQAKKEIDS